MINKVSYGGSDYFNIPLDGGELGIPKEVLTAAINEQAWGLVRVERDRRIALTDHTQAPDSPLSAEKRAAFAAYRQALRDIPQTYVSPADVDWPVPPALD